MLARKPRRGGCDISFHYQEAARNYLKALLQESVQPVPQSHNLCNLYERLLPSHPTLTSLRRGPDFLAQFTIDVCYPGRDATKRQPDAGLRWGDRVREKCRDLLGL